MTPEEAENFYEDDEDPEEIFAWFDSEPGYYVLADQARRTGTACTGDAARSSWPGCSSG
jgi:hypothetical protein